jgi:hypothetical protein
VVHARSRQACTEMGATCKRLPRGLMALWLVNGRSRGQAWQSMRRERGHASKGSGSDRRPDAFWARFWRGTVEARGRWRLRDSRAEPLSSTCLVVVRRGGRGRIWSGGGSFLEAGVCGFVRILKSARGASCRQWASTCQEPQLRSESPIRCSMVKRQQRCLGGCFCINSTRASRSCLLDVLFRSDPSRFFSNRK